MISDILTKAIEDIVREANTHPEIYKEETGSRRPTMVQCIVDSMKATREHFKCVEEGA